MPGVFVRSMAARDRLGGLADLCAAATVLMRALYDVVLIETVGVGQSETEIAELADTVVFAVQPGSGDSLQFMKAGIVEIPDVALVTKADLGGIAERAKRDLEGALGLVPGAGEWEPPVLLVSATTGQGIDAALDAIDRHAAFVGPRPGRPAGPSGAALARALAARGVRPAGCRPRPHDPAARHRRRHGLAVPLAGADHGRAGLTQPRTDSGSQRGGAGVSTASPASSGSSVGGQLIQPQQRQAKIAGPGAHLAGILAAARDRRARMRAGARRRAPAAGAS